MKIGFFAVLTIAMVACGGTTDGTAAEAETSALGADGGQGGPHGPPPQAAIDACKDLSQGDSCSFTTPQCSVTGTCQGPEGKPLACAPEGMGGPEGASGASGQNGPPPPPQAAVDACQSLSSGASCSFTGKNGDSVSGTCGGPDGKPLACIPADAPQPPPQN